VDSSQNGENGSRPLDYYNLKLEKSVAEGDTPHMVKSYISYDLPFKFHGWAKSVIGGWTVLAILNYYSGTPLAFTAPTPLTGGWNGAVNRANIAPGNLKNPSFDKSNFELSNTQSPKDTYLNKLLFSVPASLTLGTAARRYTQIRGFGTQGEDLSIQKSFWIKEKIRFALRAEFLDAFNRHQLGGINTSVNNASFGQVTSVSGNRQVQLNARIDF
jgi:hypothetical protein